MAFGVQTSPLVARRLQYSFLIAVTLVCIFLVLAGAAYWVLHVAEGRAEAPRAHRNGQTLQEGEDGDSVYDDGVEYEALPDGPHREVSTEGYETSQTEANGVTDPVPTTRWPQVSDDDLAEISRLLWDLDSNRIPAAEYALDLQGHTNKSERVDRAASRLFSRMDADLSTWSGTYSRFLPLLDNYNALVRDEEQLTSLIWQEISDFVDVIVNTGVMQALKGYLVSRGYISSDPHSFREKLFALWFEPYARSSRYNDTDSSGFEHVMVGEIRGMKVIGFHNWIQFYVQELNGHLDYQGYIKFNSSKPRFVNVRLTWHRRVKREASFLVGVSPEYDMALYTLCIVSRVSRPCPVYVDNERLVIETFDISHVPGLQVGTAFPTRN